MSKTDRLLRLAQIVPDLLPISKSSWWNGVKSGRFPKPIHLGPRTTCWRAADIYALLDSGAICKCDNSCTRNTGGKT